MEWCKPDFQEISLNMEVTGYVNTDGGDNLAAPRTTPAETTPPAATAPTAH